MARPTPRTPLTDMERVAVSINRQLAIGADVEAAVREARRIHSALPDDVFLEGVGLFRFGQRAQRAVAENDTASFEAALREISRISGRQVVVEITVEGLRIDQSSGEPIPSAEPEFRTIRQRVSGAEGYATLLDQVRDLLDEWSNEYGLFFGVRSARFF